MQNGFLYILDALIPGVNHPDMPSSTSDSKADCCHSDPVQASMSERDPQTDYLSVLGPGLPDAAPG